MLTTILDILSVIGIILLVVLICVVIILTLVLFLPIVYRSKGHKQVSEIEVWVKARWLFGFINVFYAYPTPNMVVIKCLGFELYNSSKASHKGKEDESSEQGKQSKLNNDDIKSSTNTETPQSVALQDNSQTKDESKDANLEDNTQANEQQTNQQTEETIDETSKSLIERIKLKYQKIKYTIHGIYDKIKHIVQNIAYYKNVLQEEDTKQLFQHVLFRTKKIWKNIHPRKIKANVHFGTGSPDTTGYLCGVYGMFCSYLGNSVIVQPDFEQQILEGDFYIAGHITIFQLLFHGGAILLDKKLHLFWNKIKQGGNSKNGR